MDEARFRVDPKLRAVLVVAAVWRVAYLLDYAALPFWDGPLFDSVVYLRQAASVAAGRHGDASLLAMSPLYGYFLAALGAQPVLVAVVQSAIGLGSIALAGLVGDRLEPGRGFVAAIAVASYGMFSFYESKLMSDALGLALLLGSLGLTMRAEPDGSPRVGVGAGATLGLATLARASLAPSLPLAVLAAFVFPRSGRGRFGAAFAGGLAAVLVAHGAWTSAFSGRFVPVVLTSQTFATMSGHAWDGRLRASDGSDRRPSAWDVVDQAERRLREGDRAEAAAPAIDWLGVVRGAPPKLWRTFSNTERGFDYPYYGERELVPPFAALPGSFGALLVLGVVGLVSGLASRRLRPRTLAPLLAIGVGTVATIVLTHPSSRYRIPLALVLALLTPLAVGAIERARGARRLGLVVVCGIGVAASTLDLALHERTSPASLERILATSCEVGGDGYGASLHWERAEYFDAVERQGRQ